MIRILVIAVLVVALLAKGGYLLWSSMWATPPMETATTSSAPPPVDRVNVRQLQQAHLFGQPAGPTTAPAIQPITSQPQVKSRLQAKLVGVITSDDGQRALAIIANRNQQRAYAVGETLEFAPNATLAAVEPDRVVLDVDGQLQYIELEQDKSNPRSARQPVTRKPAQPAAPARAELPKRVDIDQPEIKALAGDVRAQLRSNPMTLAKHFLLAPHTENGDLKGYRISPGRDPRLFRQLGLQQGDMITHVADINIYSPWGLKQLYDKVRDGGVVRVGIQRGGRIQEVEIDL